MVVINRPGAGGAIAMDFVAKSKPDGYVLAATTNSTLVTVPAVNKGVSYKLSDFATIGTYAVDYQAIISRTDLRWKSLGDLIAYARKNPGKVNYGSSGTGGISYFNMEILKMMEKLDIIHVPYRARVRSRLRSKGVMSTSRQARWARSGRRSRRNFELPRHHCIQGACRTCRTS